MIDWQQYDETTAIEMNPGFLLYLRANCEYSRKRFLYKIAEKNELDFLDQFDFSNFVCIDVGANIGYWCVYLNAKLHAKEVHCFEPDPTTCVILRRNLTLNNIVHNSFVNESAVHETIENATLHLISNLSANNSTRYIANVPSISVKGTSLDAYAQKQGINHVDFIKIDIEGAERAALDGCEKIIARDKPVIMLEFISENHEDDGVMLRNCLAELEEKHEMFCFRVDANILVPVPIDSLYHYNGNLFVTRKDSWLFDK